MNRHGFTLIEIIVYIGLFSLLVTGTFASAYALSISSRYIQAEALVQREGQHLVQIIAYHLDHAQHIEKPSQGEEGDRLITDVGTFYLREANLVLQDSEDITSLSSEVAVHDFSVSRPRTDSYPGLIEISFTLSVPGLGTQSTYTVVRHAYLASLYD